MIVTVQYLQPDKNGMLSYRRKFPKDLMRFLPGASPTGRGRVEFKVSLRTRNIDEAGAKERLAQAERDYLAIVEKARRVATGDFHRLDQPLIRFLADNYLHERLALDEAGRWGRAATAPGSPSRLQPEKDYIENRELLDAYDGEGLVAYWQDWARSYASELGFHLSPSDPEMPSLCRTLGSGPIDLRGAI